MTINVHESDTYEGEDLARRLHEFGTVSYRVTATGKEDIARLKAAVKFILPTEKVELNIGMML